MQNNIAFYTILLKIYCCDGAVAAIRPGATHMAIELSRPKVMGIGARPPGEAYHNFIFELPIPEQATKLRIYQRWKKWTTYVALNSKLRLQFIKIWKNILTYPMNVKHYEKQ